MSPPLAVCSDCHRHVRAAERRCPFCARPRRATVFVLVGTLMLAGEASAALADGKPAVTLTRAQLTKQAPHGPVPHYGVPPHHPRPTPRPPPNRLRPPPRIPPLPVAEPAYGIPADPEPQRADPGQ